MAAASPAPPAPAAGRFPIVDAHPHCFAGSADARFPYHPLAPYRPEKHYMRGPGPKWREKYTHAAGAQRHSDAP